MTLLIENPNNDDLLGSNNGLLGGSGWPDFDTAYDQFNGEAIAHEKTVTQYKSDKGNLQDEWKHFNDLRTSGKLDLALYYFLLVICGSVSPTNQGNILGLYNDQVQGWGQSLGANAYLQKCTNLITNLTDDTSNVPVNQQVDVLHSIILVIGGGLGDKTTAACLDPNEVQTIQGQLSSLQATLSTYFTTGGTLSSSQLASFDEMKSLLGQPGDPKQAEEAAKAITDGLQVISSSISNTNAAFNEQVSQVTAMQKSLQSCLGSFIKSSLDFMNAVIQNMLRN